MTAILRGLFRWSLEITGVSIIWYNYQPYDRQQKLLGIYNFARNSIRLTRCLYGLQQDFKAYHQNVKEKGALQVFRQATASKLKGLCQDNAGVYARIAEIISAERDIVPEEYASEFKQLLERTPEEVPYADIKTALTSIFQKDTKELFDGFQTKPFNVGLFTQSHKAVLLENYREAVVKVLLPSLKVQADHDLWLINKVKDYAIDYLKKHKVEEQSYQFFTDILREAEESVRSEINLEQELANADRNKQLMYDGSSEFYVPYYFTKFCNQHVIIREFVEGVQLNDAKGLKELGLVPEVAYAHVLSEVHHLLRKFKTISGSLNEKNILLRKYIKPYKPAATEQVSQEEQKPKKKVLKPGALIHPKYQVVFLAQNNFQQLQEGAIDNITAFWNNLKKEKTKYKPSVKLFFERLPGYNAIKSSPSELMRQKYYLYEPLIKLYESITKKA